MLRSLLAALAAALILAAPAARRRRTTTTPTTGPSPTACSSASTPLGRAGRLLPARRRRRRADGQLDAAADPLASPRCRATKAPPRNDHRARVARRRGSSTRAAVRRPSPAPARSHAPGWVNSMTNAHGRPAPRVRRRGRRRSRLRLPGARRAAAARRRPSTKIRDAIHRTARGAFWRYPTIRLNQVNWYALMYAADATVTGDTTLLRRDLSPAAAALLRRRPRQRRRAGRQLRPGHALPLPARTVAQRADERRLGRVREHRPDLHALLRPGAPRRDAGAARLRAGR